MAAVGRDHDGVDREVRDHRFVRTLAYLLLRSRLPRPSRSSVCTPLDRSGCRARSFPPSYWMFPTRIGAVGVQRHTSGRSDRQARTRSPVNGSAISAIVSGCSAGDVGADHRARDAERQVPGARGQPREEPALGVLLELDHTRLDGPPESLTEAESLHRDDRAAEPRHHALQRQPVDADAGHHAGDRQIPAAGADQLADHRHRDPLGPHALDRDVVTVADERDRIGWAA